MNLEEKFIEAVFLLCMGIMALSGAGMVWLMARLIGYLLAGVA